MKRKWRHSNSSQIYTGRCALILVRKGDWITFCHHSQLRMAMDGVTSLGTPPAGGFGDKQMGSKHDSGLT